MSERKQIAFNSTKEFHMFAKLEATKLGMSIRELVETAVTEYVTQRKNESKGDK